jgi:hypothetical protein
MLAFVIPLTAITLALGVIRTSGGRSAGSQEDEGAANDDIV